MLALANCFGNSAVRFSAVISDFCNNDGGKGHCEEGTHSFIVPDAAISTLWKRCGNPASDFGLMFP